MNKSKKLGRLVTAGILTAAMSMSMLGTALAADPVDNYGSEATTYGLGDDDVVETYTFKDGDENVTVSVPSAADRCSIAVYGIKPLVTKNAEDKTVTSYEGITVKAYHLIEGNYNRYGFTGWTQTKETAAVEGGKFETFNNVVANKGQVVAIDNFKYLDANGNPTNTKSDTTTSNPDYNEGKIITEENISSIAKAITKDRLLVESIPLTVDENGVFRSDVAEAGTYLILVETNKAGVIYNPMIVSNDYSNSSNAQSLSNVTVTKTAAITKDADRYHDEEEGRGVKVDPNNSFTDYDFALDASKVSGLLTIDDENLLPSKQDNKKYVESREKVKYVRSTEANGNVYTIKFTDGTGDENTVKTMALQGRAYAKMSTIGLEKNIVFASTDNFDDQKYNENDMVLSETDKFYYSKYDDASKGDTLTFDIMTSVPDYSNIYFGDETEFVFDIIDNQGVGLEKVDLTKVKVYAGTSVKTNAEDIAADIVKEGNLLSAKDTYAITDLAATDLSDFSDNGFKISFAKDWVLSADNANKKIIVRYATKLSKDAEIGLEGNANEVFLNYTTAPTIGEGEDKRPQRGYKFDFAMEYTFSPVVYKVDEEGRVVVDDNGEFVVDADADDYATAVEKSEADAPLAGAKFHLIRIGNRMGMADGAHTANLIPAGTAIDADFWNSDAYDELDTWDLTSQDDGLLTFDSAELNGIDEGLYALVEYEAPKGYTLNDRVYYIDITPKYNEAKKSFIGVNVALTDDKNTTLGTALLDGTHYEKAATKNGPLDQEERLLTSYEIAEWNSGTTGTADLDVNPQDDADTKITTVFSWDDEEASNKNVALDVIAIPNTKLTKLPSTGGIGTYVFTCVGLVLMGGVVVLATKKKKEEE
jgi:LPXTG-motif cell wall-anchored protein